ncbi:MAG: winged helix-turn-helix transcriptional regulator [Chloroflexi bacterium]|nr:MAG: winged helix-turn-helix transcriptional regulator [Chloroflexota bacterium]TMG69887.1 MAG: winged helix-turn-helix transcriptional regulator [Chloroflexota bacterium]
MKSGCALMDAFCDPTRIKIMHALRDTTLAASELAHVIGRSRSATSQRLRVLRETDAIIANPRAMWCDTRCPKMCPARSSKRRLPSSTSFSRGRRPLRGRPPWVFASALLAGRRLADSA